MAFTSLTSAQCDANSPLDETLMQLVRTNFDDLDDRVNALAALSSQDVRDDFIQDVTGSGVADAVIWDSYASTLTGAVIAPHQYKISGAATGQAAIQATGERMHIDTGEDYVAVLEFRIKNAGTDADWIAVGFIDRSIVDVNLVNYDANFIGIVRGSGSDWDIRVASGGTDTDNTGHGTQATWTKFKFTVTCTSTGSPSVAVDVDDVSIGAAITTNIPATVLRPVVNVYFASGGAADLRIDYVLSYFNGRPLAA